MKYSAIEIAGMLQDNQDTISKLKEEVEKYKALANPKPKAVFIVVFGVVLQQRNPKHDDKLFKSNRVNCINQIYN